MEWHPYAKLFPMMSDEEIQSLADDIRENGQRHAAIVNADDLVLDGRNRLVACKLAGVEPVIEARDYDDREALAFVISANIHRRHLTESQRADIAARIATTKAGGDRKSKNQTANLPNGQAQVTNTEAAQLLNVSERSVRSAKKVQQHGAPELQQAVTDGRISVSRAAKVAELPKRQQAAEVRGNNGRQRQQSERAFDESRGGQEIRDWLRRKLNQWPEDRRQVAGHWIRHILEEFRI